MGMVLPDGIPFYPSGESSEVPGTVFTTDAGGVDTIWVVMNIDHGVCVSVSRVKTPVGGEQILEHVSLNRIPEREQAITDVSYRRLGFGFALHATIASCTDFHRSS